MKLTIKLLITLGIILSFNSCANIPISIKPVNIGGSKSDGILTYGYRYNSMQYIKNINWDNALEDAKKRCQYWGYKDAIFFDGKKYNSNGSSREVIRNCQCTNEIVKKEKLEEKEKTEKPETKEETYKNHNPKRNYDYSDYPKEHSNYPSR